MENGAFFLPLLSMPLSRAYRTAAIMSPGAKAHAGFNDPYTCPLCGAQDSIHHLLPEFPELADFRINLDVQTLVAKLPRATLLTGLPSVSVPHQQHSAAWEKVQHLPKVHLFTDGSTDPSDLPPLTLAAWSVVAWLRPCTWVPIDWGPLPGQKHSIVRAEAFAVLKAFDCPRPCKVFCDNAAVCTNFQQLISAPFLPHQWFDKQDCDIWCQISAQIAAKGPHWVAHRSPDTPGLLEAEIWEIRGTDSADRLAKQTLRLLTAAQTSAWSLAVREANNYLRHIRKL